MWADILIAAIFVFSTVQGYRNGFVDTCIHAVGWVLALVLGFVWQDQAAAFLRGRTEIYDTLYTGIGNQLRESGHQLLSGLPASLREMLGPNVSTFSDSLAADLAQMLFGVLAFLLVVIFCKLLLWVLSVLISKKRNEGLLGALDGLLGLLMGIIRGVLLVYLTLALLVPLSGILSGDLIAQQLNSSSLAGSLYDNNPLFLIIHDLL